MSTRESLDGTSEKLPHCEAPKAHTLRQRSSFRGMEDQLNSVGFQLSLQTVYTLNWVIFL